MRASFRRENRFIKASMQPGSAADDLYKPKLWYYERLLFTLDHEEVRNSTSSLQTSTSASTPDENIECMDDVLSPEISQMKLNRHTLRRHLNDQIKVFMKKGEIS